MFFGTLVSVCVGMWCEVVVGDELAFLLACLIGALVGTLRLRCLAETSGLGEI